MTSADYREAHQLPRTLSLRAAAITERAREQGRDRYRKRPDIRANLDAGRKDAPDTPAVSSSQETALRPMVRSVRRRGGQGKAAAERRRMLEKLEAAGFTSLEVFLADRQGTSLLAMARELGVPRMTLDGWIRRAATSS